MTSLVARRWGRLPAGLRGPVWMVASGVCLVAMSAMVRHVSGNLAAPEIVFFRCLFGLIALLPLLVRRGRRAFSSRRVGGHLLRALCAVAAWTLWFYALGRIPLADAIALGYTTPLFTSIIAVIFLGEVMRLRRWTATLVGFAGVMIIVRPGFAAIDPAFFAVLAATLGYAMVYIMTKVLTRSDSPLTIIIYMGVLTTPLALVEALFFWAWPTPGQFAWLAAIGIFAVTAHACLGHAMRAAETTLLMPFTFLNLIFATLIGLAAFGEFPDRWTIAGVLVIFTATAYLTQREARARKAAARQKTDGAD